MGYFGAKTMAKRVLALLFTLGCSACTSVPLKNAVLSRIETPIGVATTRSMGEALLTKYTCPCYEYFEATNAISFQEYNRPVSQGSEWVARYFNPDSHEKYLINPAYHPALALVLDPASQSPTLSADHALLQFQGAKRGRSWKVADGSSTSSIRFAGYMFTRTAWRLQYIGPDKQQPKVLRFTIDDLRDNRERVGQVEYAHDLTKGSEFVVRGVRLRIMNVAPDGLISYVVVSDNERYGP